MNSDVQGHGLAESRRPPLAQRSAAGQHVERRVESPCRIILMGDGRPEERQYRIAEELRDKAVIAGDRLAEGLEERVLKRAHVFRIETLGERRKSGEVCEQDGYLATIRLSAWRNPVAVLDGFPSALGLARDRRAPLQHGPVLPGWNSHSGPPRSGDRTRNRSRTKSHTPRTVLAVGGRTAGRRRSPVKARNRSRHTSSKTHQLGYQVAVWCPRFPSGLY